MTAVVRGGGLVGFVGVLGLVVLSGCGSDDPPFSDALMERLRAEGVAPGLVYTVEVPGHELVEQSVGVHGDDGFGAVYVRVCSRELSAVEASCRVSVRRSRQARQRSSGSRSA